MDVNVYCLVNNILLFSFLFFCVQQKKETSVFTVFNVNRFYILALDVSIFNFVLVQVCLSHVTFFLHFIQIYNTYLSFQTWPFQCPVCVVSYSIFIITIMNRGSCEAKMGP